MRLTKRMTTLAGVAGIALVLSACGSDDAESGIVQLDGDGGATAAAEDQGSAEEQALAFAQCMRDNGVDFPDPTVDADGNPSFEGAFGRGQEGGFDPGDSSFRDAMTACGDLMEGLMVGPGGGQGFDQEAISEALYLYTSCLRDEGLDVGDITLDSMMGPPGDAPDAGAVDAGEQPTLAPPAGEGDQPPGPADGERGPGGDMTDRFAEQLGQDPEDPAWIAASETCQPVLEEALTGAGVGGQGGAA